MWSDSAPGVTQGSTPLWKTHSLFLYEENGTLSADYTINGYQLGMKIQASVYGDDETITVVLTGYAPDTDQQRYALGDELLRLTRTANGLTTTWLTIHPLFGPDRPPEGVYLQKDSGAQEFL